MKKYYLSGFVLALFICFVGSFQQLAAITVSTDTAYYVDFNTKPVVFPEGDYDIYALSASNANKETTINGVTFGAGANGQRIHIKTTQSASQYGSSATTYISASVDDDGANTGAISFIKSGSGSAGGGYFILPQQQGPVDISIWNTSGYSGTATQKYDVYVSTNGGAFELKASYSVSSYSIIYKKVYSYTENSPFRVKFVCTSTSNSTCNLYYYDVLMTKRPSIELTSSIGTDNQTVSTYANESIANIVYTWGSIASSATISWTGTTDVNTPPTGLTVITDAASKTVTITGTPTVLGSYSYSISSSNGIISSNVLSGAIKVVDTPVPLISLTSAAGTNVQSVTEGVTITNIQYTWGGSASETHLIWSGTASSTIAPAGVVVTQDSQSETVVISGAPTTAGSYGWTITSTDGTLTSPALTGTLTVVPPPSLTLTSDISTTNQTVGFCKAICSIVLSYGGSATSASLVWAGTPESTTSPAGITVTTNTTTKTITISGMPYLTGTYKLTVTSTDGTLTSAAVTATIISSATVDVLPSFPGAVGYGSHATGGRGGAVYHVTNLDDSGTGSFRDAVSASNRIIVFDVSGYITLKTAVSCKSNLTIAGQTAPGAGIGFRGGEISFASQQNIICRHIRIVPGSETASTGDDALSLYLARNAILDHCTFEFSPWNNIDGVSDNYKVYPVTGITLQNCIDANPTYQQFGAHCESVLAQWTFYRNLFANSHNRNPLSKIDDQFINNVEYNNEAGYTTHTSTPFKHDIVNNYFIFGPASGSNVPWYQIDPDQSIYYPGNLCDNNKDGALNGTTTTPYWYSGEGTVLTAPWSPLTSKIPTVDATSAYRTVVSKVGTLPLSQLDSLIISQVKTLGSGTTGYVTGTTGPAGGLYTDQTQTGLPNNGYGTIASGTKETDTDNDGMPDYWEIATGLNVNADDAMLIASNGYANIENYFNWIADLHANTFVNTALNIDLSKYAGGFSSVSPAYSTSSTVNGAVALQADGHTVRFTPTTGFSGIGSFKFTVTGSDNTSYTDSVKIVISGSSVCSPADQSTSVDTLNLALSWTAPANVISYNVYGGTDKNNLTSIASNLSSPNYTWPQLSAGTVYYWRTDALNTTSTIIGNVISFTTKYCNPGKVSKMLPANQSVNADTLNLTLSWTAGVNALTYNVYGGLDESNLSLLASNVSASNYVWSALLPKTVYYWRVDALNPAGTAVGDVTSFTTKYRTPGKATNLLPADQAVNVDTINLALSWTACANAASYTIYGGTNKNSLSRLATDITSPDYTWPQLVPGSVYYWRVDASNITTTTAGTLSSFTTKYRIPGKATTAIPAVQSVNADTLNLSLSWSAAANATSYGIYGGTDADNLSLLASNVSSLNFSWPQLSAGTVYYWRVDASNPAGTALGSISSFTTKYRTPGIVTSMLPADQAANVDTLNLALSWTAAVNATSYRIYGSTDKDNLLLLASDVSASNFTWSQLEAGTVYYWRVDAYNATAVTTGSVQAFTTKYRAPGKVSGMLPIDLAVNADTSNLNLSWIASANAFSYSVYGGTDKNSLILLASDVLTTNYTLPQLTAGTVYYWRVDASNPTTITSGSIVAFTTKYPTPGKVTNMLPADLTLNVDTLNLALSWTAGAYATSYNIYGGTDKNDLISVATDVKTSSYTYAQLAPGTVYYWRVDAFNPTDTTLGSVVSFTTKYRSPGKVTGMKPVDLAVTVDTVNLVVSWSAAANATKYNVYLGTSANKLILKSAGTAATSLTIAELNGNTKYYWRVDAINGLDTTKGSVISFTTKSALNTDISNLVVQSLSVYPNPFTDNLFVKLDVEAKEHVSLFVYDFSGKLISVLEDAVLNSGSYEFNWNGKGLNGEPIPGGIYLLKVKAGNSQTVKKINYIRP